MAPLRGAKRKRRDKNKKLETNSDFPLSPSLDSSDWWVAFSRRVAGNLNQSQSAEPLQFKSLFKMERKTFDYICSLIQNDLISKSSNYCFTDGVAMCVADQVAVALRRLSSGDSLVNVGSAFGTNHSTVSQVTWRFVEAMERRGLQHLQWPVQDEMERIKSKFESTQGLPNCCGAIDSTHIMLCLPSAEPNCKVWLDTEKNHSMVLQAIVDPDMRFIDLITGWPGSMNELEILRSSGFYKLCERGSRLNGNTRNLLEGSEIGEYIIGDTGYPLLPWLITPYQGKEISSEKLGFNKVHLATRAVASQALARFKDMWRFFQGEMWRPDKHRLPRIILVCCLLHNIIIDLEGGEREEREEISVSVSHDLNYRQNFCQVEDEKGVLVRESLARYLAEKLANF